VVLFDAYDAYNESADLIKSIDDYRTRYGYYPEAVIVDKAYRTRENIRYCKSKGIRISDPRLGRIMAHLRLTANTVINLSFLAMNLVKRLACFIFFYNHKSIAWVVAF